MAGGAPQKDAELILNSTGNLQSKEGNWGEDVDHVVSSVWKVLRETKHLLLPSESLKRITVTFEGREYVITGKDGAYHVIRWSKD
mmetsp:Transcript_19755/g.35117  ORF Transcript_19755/g.35117 Transcript_19755/m.35117 type:complete len:85 (+) Transcript_19755:53-307(+)